MSKAQWVSKSLMAGGVLLGAVVSGGLLPVGFAALAVALGTAGGYFNVSDAQRDAIIRNTPPSGLPPVTPKRDDK